MSPDDLSSFYRGYIDCLNRQDWACLGQFVHEEVEHDGRQFGLAGYRSMLESDFRAIPDLRFDIRLLVCEPPCIAARLFFDCSPIGELFGLPVHGRRITFHENVFYKVQEGRIRWVWSIIDKAGISGQLVLAAPAPR